MATLRTQYVVFPVVLMSLLFLGLFGCSGSQERPSATTADSTLSEEQWSKIDPDLTRLMTDSVKITDVPTRRRADGTRVFAVWIQPPAREALEAAGVTTDSTREDRVRVWLSLAEMRELARLETIERLRADNDPVPRNEPE